jgi:hypothetical protein
MTRIIKRRGSNAWPVAKATVMSSSCPRAGYGCDVAEVYYTYRVDGELYTGANENWRRVRDSNPRYPLRYAGFQDRCHQPLGQLSAAGSFSVLHHFSRSDVDAIMSPRGDSRPFDKAQGKLSAVRRSIAPRGWTGRVGRTLLSDKTANLAKYSQPRGGGATLRVKSYPRMPT